MSAPISDDLHKLKGTRPTRAAQPEYVVPAGHPKFPKRISADAKVVFKQLVKQLQDRRACTAGDVEILYQYSELRVRWEKARAKVVELGEVFLDKRTDNHGELHEVWRKSPWLAIAQESEKQMHAILRDLGLTPNARAKVKPTAAADEKPKDAPLTEDEVFDDFLKHGPRWKETFQQ